MLKNLQNSNENLIFYDIYILDMSGTGGEKDLSASAPASPEAKDRSTASSRSQNTTVTGTDLNRSSSIKGNIYYFNG